MWCDVVVEGVGVGDVGVEDFDVGVVVVYDGVVIVLGVNGL